MAQTGARFETYVLAAMSEVGLTHKAELYRRSGMGSSTWAGWFTGQRQPRGNSLRLASAALNKTPDELKAVWEGDKPHKRRRATEPPDPLLVAVGDLTTTIAALVGEIRSEREDGRDVVTAFDRAVVRLLEALRPGDTEVSGERSVRRETGG